MTGSSRYSLISLSIDVLPTELDSFVKIHRKKTSRIILLQHISHHAWLMVSTASLWPSLQRTAVFNQVKCEVDWHPPVA